MTNPNAMALMHDLVTAHINAYDFSTENWSTLELVDLYEIDAEDFDDAYPNLHEEWFVRYFNIKADLAIEIANRACDLIRKYHEELGND